MSKAEDRALLEALLRNGNVPTTKKLETVPMSPALSASRAVAMLPKGEEERDQKPVKPKAKRVKRNWAAQRRYDEQHGTVNGYDERIEDALAFRRREAGDY